MLALGQDVVTAQLSVTPVECGSWIVWSCQYSHKTSAAWGDKQHDDLVVIDTAGAATTVASWLSARDASGLTATTAIPASSIRSVEIRQAERDSAFLR